MDALAMPWANARVAHLLAVWRMMPIEVGDNQEGKFDSNDDDLLMYTQKAETLEPFSSHIIPVKAGKAYLGECINVMIQALWTQDGTLPPSLTIQNTYTELRKGSKKVVVVVQNNTTYLQTLQKKGVRPSNIKLKAIAKYAPLQTFTKIRAFLGLVGHYRQFIKGFAWIAQPLNDHLAGEGASRKSEWVSLSKEALEAFQALKQACMNSRV